MTRLDFSDISSELTTFRKEFDSYINSCKSRIQKDSTSQSFEYTKNLQLIKQSLSQLEQWAAKKNEMITQISSEKKEIETARLELAQLVEQNSRLVKKKKEALRQRQALESKVKTLTLSNQEIDLKRERTRAFNSKILSLYTKYLGCNITVEDQDLLLFVFKVNDRQFTMKVDLSGNEYKVTCPDADISKLVSQLNTDREFYNFLRNVRQFFSSQE